MSMAQGRSDDSPFVFRIERTFDAPRERVWTAWTDAEQLRQWFGPKGCSVPYCTVDLRSAGAARFCIAYNGVIMWAKWTYQELKAPEKLVAIVSFTDESGDAIVEHPASPGWPLEILSNVTFTESAGRTTVLVEWTAHRASQAQRRSFEDGDASMQQGWGGSFEQLQAFLAKGR